MAPGVRDGVSGADRRDDVSERLRLSFYTVGLFMNLFLLTGVEELASLENFEKFWISVSENCLITTWFFF